MNNPEEVPSRTRGDEVAENTARGAKAAARRSCLYMLKIGIVDISENMGFLSNWIQALERLRT